MSRATFSFGLLAAALIAPSYVSAATAPAAEAAPDDPLEDDWRTIADDDLLVMQLPGERRIIIRLADGFAPAHVGNVRALARARWWDGTSFYRSQDNWVVQWGGAADDKPIPRNIHPQPAAEVDFPPARMAQRLNRTDSYAVESGISREGWPLASDGKRSWLPHCYAMVGVVHGAAPDTGTGSELFAVIGSARALDRAYTVIGRVIVGMEHLSTLPRSGAPLGFYEAPAERTPILSVRLAADIPEDERPRYQYRAADNARFEALIADRVNAQPPRVALGGVNVCDVPSEVRKTPPP